MQPPFQVGDIGICAAETLHLVKGFQKNRYDRILGLLSGAFAFGVHIEKDHIGRGICRQLHVGEDHIVADLIVFFKIVDGASAVHDFVGKQIGEYFQKVRFTASEEAGDPNAHLVCRSDDAALIAGKEIGKMLLQFSCDHIFFQFLLYVFVFALSDLDNALDIPVDRLCKNTLYLHIQSSSIHRSEAR